MSKEEILSSLKSIVGPENVKSDIFEILPYHTEYLQDTSVLKDKSDIALAVVQPVDSSEVSEILKLANEKLVPVRVRSGGTGVGGSMAQKGEIVMDLYRMNWIRIYKEDGYAEAGPAVHPMDIDAELEKFGCNFPVYPTNVRSSGMGGVVAINTSGMSVDPYLGKPGDYILGLEVVLPTGEVIQTGTKTLRQPAGLDLTRLFIGSEGLFGIVTNVRFRLVKKPADRKWAFVIFDSLRKAAKAVQELHQQQGPYPTKFEIVDEQFAKNGFEKIGIKVPEGACLLIETGGKAPGEAQWKLDQILEVCKRQNPKHIRLIADESEWLLVFSIREFPEETVGTALLIIGAAFDAKVSNYAEVIDEFNGLREKIASVDYREVYPFLFGHAGGPSYHPNLAYGPNLDFETRKKLQDEYLGMIHDLLIKYEGSIGEMGLFPKHANWFVKKYGKIHYELLKKMHDLFDPNDILNRGKLP